MPHFHSGFFIDILYILMDLLASGSDAHGMTFVSSYQVQAELISY